MREAEKENSKALFRRYKPYPAYKDSGVEWLREVPEHWGIQRLRHTVSSCQNGTWGEEPVGDSGDMICIRVADFDRTKNKIAVLSVPTLRYIPQQQQEKFILNSGELLIEKSGGGDQQPVGVVMLYDLKDRAVCSNFIARMRVKTNNNAIFLLYLHKHLYESGLNWRSIKQNTGIQNLDLKSYLSEYVVMPSITEQYKIADFLERETAKIDALIARQEQLIELLQEKRAALISHAVTKGLDPKAPMKDSGVVWLGEIPAHWELKRTKYLFRIMSGSTPNSSEPDYWNGDLPWVTPEDLGVLDGFIISETRRNITLNGYLSCATNMVPVGSIIVSTRAPIGHIAIAQVELCTNQGCRALIPSEGLDSRYFYHIFSVAKQELQSFGQGSTFRELSKADLGSLLIPRPPLREQELISEALGKKTSEMDGVIKKTRASIKLLKEYRTALISAAVTGKIDVREEVSSA